MSTERVTVVNLRCDHEGCEERSDEFIGHTTGLIRREAHKTGWTHRRVLITPDGAAVTRDYCPAHRPSLAQRFADRMMQ